MVAVPARHPCSPSNKFRWKKCCAIRWRWATGSLRRPRAAGRSFPALDQEPLIAQRVATFDVMMTLVSAGLALGLAGEAHIASSREPGVVARRWRASPMLTTYLLRRDAEPSEMLARFIERVAFIDSADGIDTADDA
jgi:DNA-binding transcriptional LysR family regulator